MYSIEDIKKSIRIYNFLQQNGELTLNDDKEIYTSYSDENVKEILKAIGEEAKVYIRKYDDTIYLIPEVENEFLGYKRAELKKEIFGRTDTRNIDYYLAMYIIILLITEFYGGKGSKVRTRDFIEIGDIDEKITDKLETFINHDNEASKFSAGIAIIDISKHWFTLINEDEAKSVRTRRWYIYQVCSFLKKEKMINIQDDTIIIPTNKLNRLVANYFLNFERLDEINHILNINNFSDGDGEDAEIK
jgi:hypothetical protein